MQHTLMIGFGLLVATFRTGDTEIFRIDPNTGDAINLIAIRPRTLVSGT